MLWPKSVAKNKKKKIKCAFFKPSRFLKGHKSWTKNGKDGMEITLKYFLKRTTFPCLLDSDATFGKENRINFSCFHFCFCEQFWLEFYRHVSTIRIVSLSVNTEVRKWLDVSSNIFLTSIYGRLVKITILCK